MGARLVSICVKVVPLIWLFAACSKDNSRQLENASVGARCEPWPTAQGVTAVTRTIVIASSFDGELQRFVGAGALATDGQTEDQRPLFKLEPGATLRNAILGSPAADGVHCRGACTLENVWWEDVGEDAATFRGDSPEQVSTVRCGGARHAADKVFQHNGAGTVVIEDFTVDTFGKLYRSCGNCKTQRRRSVILRNVTAKNGGTLVGINENEGDSAQFSRIATDRDVTICTRFEANQLGLEPVASGSGPDPRHCRYASTDIRGL